MCIVFKDENVGLTAFEWIEQVWIERIKALRIYKQNEICSYVLFSVIFLTYSRLYFYMGDQG